EIPLVVPFVTAAENVAIDADNERKNALAAVARAANVDIDPVTAFDVCLLVDPASVDVDAPTLLLLDLLTNPTKVDDEPRIFFVVWLFVVPVNVDSDAVNDCVNVVPDVP